MKLCVMKCLQGSGSRAEVRLLAQCVHVLQLVGRLAEFMVPGISVSSTCSQSRAYEPGHGLLHPNGRHGLLDDSVASGHHSVRVET